MKNKWGLFLVTILATVLSCLVIGIGLVPDSIESTASLEKVYFTGIFFGGLLAIFWFWVIWEWRHEGEEKS